MNELITFDLMNVLFIVTHDKAPLHVAQYLHTENNMKSISNKFL